MNWAALEYTRPAGLEQALELLEEPGSRALGGGAQLIPALRRGGLTCRRVVDISRLPELNGLQVEGDALWVGAAVTLRDLTAHPAARERLPLLVEAAGMSGDPAFRNAATLGGQVVWNTPGLPLLAALYALDPQVILLSRSGERARPLQDFTLVPGGLVRGLRVPFPVPGERSVLLRAGRTQNAGPAAATVCAAGRLEAGRLRGVRLTAGGETLPVRHLYGVEAAVEGRSLSADTLQAARDAALAALSPVLRDQLNGEYLIRVLAGLACRALQALNTRLEAA